MSISFTVLTSTNCSLTKEFRLVDGVLVPGTIANMATGESTKMQIDDVSQLNAVLQLLGPNNALCCGLNMHGDTALTTRRAAELGDPGTPRIGSAFTWPLGAALFPIDVDVAADGGTEFRSVDAVLDALESCSGWLKDALRVARPSASSYVHGRGLRGVHVYLAVTDGQKIPELAKRLQDDQWLAGRRSIKISRSGALLVRQLSDASIYQTQRILFEAAPLLHEGVTRHVPEDQQWVVRARAPWKSGRPPGHADNGLIDVARLAPLKTLSLRQVETMRAMARQHSKPEANRVAFRWHLARAEAQGWDIETAERMATAAIQARDTQQLPRDMLIAFEHGGLWSVGDIMARWDEVAGESCAAPDDALRDDLTPMHYTKAVLTARNSKRGIFSYKDQTFYAFQEQSAPAVDRWTRAAIKLDGAIDYPERMGKGSTPQSNAVTALAALNDELGRPLRYNAATSTANDVSKAEAGKILLALPRLGCLGMTDAGVKAAMATVMFSNSYDPWRDFIDALPMWDGVPRLDTLFEDVCGAPSSPALTATGQYLFAGLVRRQIAPGASHDVVPVLISEAQGWGKSRHFVKALAAAVGCPATPAIEFADPVKMSLLARTSMVAELAEMSGHAKRDVEAVKTWATNSDDVYRDLYEVSAAPHPRRFVLIGTANKHELNNDSTGNRRFMPVMVTHEIDPAWTVEVPQLLAEAKERFCENADAYGLLAATAARAVDTYTKEQMRRGFGTPTDGLDEWLLPIFDKLLAIDTQKVRSANVLAQVKLAGLNRDIQPKKIAEWARSRGWTSEKKYNGNVYYPPVDYVPLDSRSDNDAVEPLKQPINPFDAVAAAKVH